MKLNILFLSLATLFVACDGSNPDVEPNDNNFPFRIILDTDEGAALASEEDYALEIKFADYLGNLPNTPININYTFSDVEGSFIGVVEIDEIIYKVEIEDCEYEREIDFTDTQIMLMPDNDLGHVPEEFEIVFKLPALDDTEGGFAFSLTDLSSSANVLLNIGEQFEFEVLENELAGEWVLDLSSEEKFENFKSVFSGLNAQLAALTFADITGEAVLELEYAEGKIEIELTNPEVETICEDGETEEEEIHLELEFEWDGEDGELEFEGSYEVEEDDLIEELDFVIEAEYEIDNDQLIISFFKIIGEDNWEDGEELFLNENGTPIEFIKD